jgi:hypothetical protein
MKHTIARFVSTILLTALPVAVTFAQATGGPAKFEHQSPPSVVDSLHAKEETQIGPYQRYLMVNGMSEDQAVRAAATIDHPSTSTKPRFAKAR